ncbi:MAG: hypothetical protein AAFU79_05160 [Myxococcota bacterium]
MMRGPTLHVLTRSAGAMLIGGALLWSSPAAHARTVDACQEAWSKAVRSYLTKNRKAAPDGTVPKQQDLDGMEAAAQQWIAAFRPACEIEADGDKPSARVEAAMIGVKILARLDTRGCSRFLEYYMQSSRSQEICRGAATRPSEVTLRDQIGTSIPRR